MKRGMAAAAACLGTIAVLATAAPVQAYDTGPHQEITAGALAAEGFGADAIGVTQVNNWFTDLYHDLSAHKIPYSGEAGFWKRLLLTAPNAEEWPSRVVAAATRSHFDDWPGVPVDAQNPSLGDTAGVTAEWNRLRRSVWTLVREARDNDDPEQLLAVLGISLHEVQDFYSHSNWIEPRPSDGIPGSDGPGWKERGFGSNPTWFDIPAAERDAVTIYGDSTTGHRRHGLWNADGNKTLVTAINKDWPGRPYHLRSAITAYYATRQWIQAVRSWVDDDAFWAEASHFKADRPELDHDLKGRFEIMLYSGHWQGQGEPLGGDAHGVGGSLPDLRQAVKHYFEPGSDVRDKSIYRERFEKLITKVADRNPTGELGPVPSSQSLQRSTRIVVLRIPQLLGEGLGDPGPDQADMYANVRIDGEWMTSAVIHGEDHFGFPDPYEPFTWFKAVPAVPNEREPVESVEVEVKTANVRWAGTDDDVYLRLGPGLRFPLDKRLYNDFERGDRDTYSVPIDAALWKGMRVGDISEVGIEKSGDGIAGGWRLGGISLRVNGEPVYSNQRIDRWLEDDKRTWTAPDFQPSDPRGAKIPVVIHLGEDDTLYGGDDDGDINPFDHRRDVEVSYTPGQSKLQTRTSGGDKLGGRWGDSNEASIFYTLETITPEPPSIPALPGDPPPPPPDPRKPDLVITGFNLNSVTVKNQGDGNAAPFRVRISNGDEEPVAETVSIPGLAAGASITRNFSQLSCEGEYLATADDLEEIEESDETNNSEELEPFIC